jgi:hypothetical protein
MTLTLNTRELLFHSRRVHVGAIAILRDCCLSPDLQLEYLKWSLYASAHK